MVATHRPLIEAGRVADYFDANVRLRMGEAALARFKARPERVRGDDRAAAPPLHRVPAGDCLDETYPRARVARGLRAHPLPGARHRWQRGSLSDGRHASGAGGGDHPRRALWQVIARRRGTFRTARTGRRSSR